MQLPLDVRFEFDPESRHRHRRLLPTISSSGGSWRLMSAVGQGAGSRRL
jgi:hypothetical protein